MRTNTDMTKITGNAELRQSTGAQPRELELETVICLLETINCSAQKCSDKATKAVPTQISFSCLHWYWSWLTVFPLVVAPLLLEYRLYQLYCLIAS